MIQLLQIKLGLVLIQAAYVSVNGKYKNGGGGLRGWFCEGRGDFLHNSERRKEG